GSSPPKLERTDMLTFFSAEEVARARSYHRPLYWAGTADVVIEASVLAALVWSGAGPALDPGSLPWWGRTPAYAAIVVAGSAAVRAPLALWSGLIRERRWGFSTQRLSSLSATCSSRTRAVAPGKRTRTCPGLRERGGSWCPTPCSKGLRQRKYGSWSPTSSVTSASGTCCSGPCSRWQAQSPQRSLSG